MLSLIPPSLHAEPASLTTPGGFAWWYVDLLDEHGDGVVLIWAFALPFLPGVESGARAGRPQAPLDHPTLNLAVYEGGRQVFYSLMRFRSEEAEIGPGHFRFGDSVIEVRLGLETQVHASLVLRVPGSDAPARARIALHGALRTGDLATPPHAHRWCPLVPHGEGQAQIEAGAQRWEFRGRGYFDRNEAPRALGSLGIGTWTWARVAFPDHTRLLYALEPAGEGEPLSLVLDASPEGALARSEATVAVVRSRRTLWGMHIPTVLQGSDGVCYAVGRVLDDGPFYVRMQLAARTPDGRAGLGYAEVVRPDRLDLDRHRPLVSMAVSPAEGRGSLWSPLFAGPRADRYARLWRHWTGGTRYA